MVPEMRVLRDLELAAKASVGEAARGRFTRQFPETRVVSPTEEEWHAGPHITPGLSDNVWS